MGNSESRRAPATPRQQSTPLTTTPVAATKHVVTTPTTAAPATTPTIRASGKEVTTPVQVFTVSRDGLISKSPDASWDGQSAVTSFGLSTYLLHATSPSSTISSPPSSSSSYLLPISVMLSALLLFISMVLFFLLFRKRQKSSNRHLIDKRPSQVALQIYPDSSTDRGTHGVDVDNHDNHVYVEQMCSGTKDVAPEGQYAYVSKPKMSRVGYSAPSPGHKQRGTPSTVAARTAIRSTPDGGTTSGNMRGVVDDVFGEEGQYNVLFEDTPQILNLIITNGYENHTVTDPHRSYATITELPGFTYFDMAQDEPDVDLDARDMHPIQGDARLRHYCDSGHGSETSIADSNGGSDFIIKPVGTGMNQIAAGGDPSQHELVLYENTSGSLRGSTNSQNYGEPEYYVLDSNDSNAAIFEPVAAGLNQITPGADSSQHEQVLYENASGSTDSRHDGEPKYYVLDGPMTKKIHYYSDKDDNVYHSITE